MIFTQKDYKWVLSWNDKSFNPLIQVNDFYGNPSYWVYFTDSEGFNPLIQVNDFYIEGIIKHDSF